MAAPQITKTCRHCGQEFQPERANRGGLYCSIRCAARHRTRPSAEDRLWRSVEVRDLRSCWLWTGCVNEGGYGRVPHRGRILTAHRLAYRSMFGDFPDDLKVLHKCDNPRCCNPIHLRLGTQAENVADMDQKGRRVPPKGERNQAAKLTAGQVVAIRRDTRTQQAIADSYGLKQAAISAIKLRKSWRHVPD